VLVRSAEADDGSCCSRVSKYLEPECWFLDWLQVQEQRRRRPAEVIDVADSLRNRVAALEKLPLSKIFSDLRALLPLLLLLLLMPLLLLLMPLLLVLLLPLVLPERLELGEICSRFLCC
jgi:hypothetical protein